MWYSAVGYLVTLTLSLLAAPLTVMAQPQGNIPLVGVLEPGLQQPRSTCLTAFQQGLRDLGYVEGQQDRLPALAAELVRLPVDILVTAGPPAVRAAQQATTTMPIVAAAMHEPVTLGFVASLARPGGNITGQAFQDTELSTKRLELLKEAVPQLTRLVVLWEPTGGGARAVRAVEDAAQALGLTLPPLLLFQTTELLQ